jgi:diguanylate cyclase
MDRPFSVAVDQPVDEQLAHLRLLGRAAAAANDLPSLEQAAHLVLEDVCHHTGWPAGRLWTRSRPLPAGPDSPALVCTSVTYPDHASRGPVRPGAVAVPPVTGAVAEAASSRRVVWGAKAESWGPSTGQPDAGGGLAFAFPVPAGDEVVAVLEFYGHQPGGAEEGLTELMGTVCHHLGRLVERLDVEAELRHSERWHRLVMGSALDAIITSDAQGVIVAFNAGAERAFGYTEAEAVGQPLSCLMPSRFREAHAVGLARASRGANGDGVLVGRTTELTALHRDGEEFQIELALSEWTVDGELFYTGVVRDITERRQAEEDRSRFDHQLASRSLHDALTSLPNRALLLDRLEQALARAAREGTELALLSVNLDRFKAVNDSYGHHIGDELLVTAARRLEAAVAAGTTIARIGGDEFALLVDPGGPEEARLTAEQVSAAIAEPFVVDAMELLVTASVGMTSVTPGQGRPSADQFLRDAEIAREHSRRRGPGLTAVYDSNMRAGARARRTAEHELRVALQEGQLVLHYQPIVELASGSIVGVEALVRWEHPERGLLPPRDFVGLAEETGLIVPLGRWVLDEACRQGAAWQRNPTCSGGLRVSVNVSARQFQQPQWVDEVAASLLASGFNPALLVLEITESILMEDTETTSHRLVELRELGSRVAIDDFGTGYSSLGYLRRFPVDILKVDKSFIDGVAEGPHESALARAVIKLAATLHLDAVAEGVTTRRQVATLRRLRCRFAQGYHFARPQPVADLDALLAHQAVDLELSDATG